MLKKIILCWLAASLAYGPLVAIAATPSPGAGWVAGVSTTGQTVWFGPSTATKTSLQMGQSIWASAVSPATGAKLTATTELAVGAAKASVVAKGVVTGANVFAAVKLLTMGGGGALGIGLTALTLAPMAIEYFTTNKSRLGPLSARGSAKPFEVQKDIDCPAGCVQYSPSSSSEWFPTTSAACARSASLSNVTLTYPGHGTYSVTSVSGLVCHLSFSGDTSFGPHTVATDLDTRTVPSVPGLEWVPASMDDIAPYMDKPVTPAQIDSLLDSGAAIPITTPSVTGPATVTGTPTVKVTNDGTNTTTTTTTPKNAITYSTGSPSPGAPVAPKITVTTSNTTVTSIVNNSTGSVTNTTTTTETAPAPIPPKTAEPQDIETCGLPGKPKCAIDETDTPEKVASDEYNSKLDDYQTKQGELKDKVSGNDDKSFFSGWSGVFVTPPLASCSVYTLPRNMGEIDPCPVVDGVRNVMAYIWAITALWLSLGMIRRVV